MKRVCILIGDWPDNFINNIRFFQNLEKEFDCTITRSNEFELETEIGDCKIEFKFCFGPLKDDIWRERKEIRAKEGRNLPPSIEEVSKRIKRFDEIYYLGFCGVLKGKPNQFYLPSKFKEILFSKYLISNKSSKECKINKEIAIKNILIDRIEGVICSCMTSNQVLSLKYVENSAHETLISLAETVAKEADIIEMENYEVAKRFGNKFPLGILLYGGDSPLRKEHMLGSNSKTLKMDVNQFVKGGTELIRLITR